MTSPPDSANHGSSQSSSQVQASPPQAAQHVVRRTRMGGWWIASALFAVLLLLLLIFILENGQRADIGFFGAHGHLPLGVALLLAAILGVLLVVIPGTGRIIQLRMLARRHRKTDASRVASSQPVPVTQPADPAPGPS
jgi:uncharacterized integral membrane protein